MTIPIALLLALALASGFMPRAAATTDAKRMLDASALAAQVLDGAPAAQPAQQPEEPLGPALVHSAITAGAAIALAALTLGRRRLPVAVRRAVRGAWFTAVRPLRALHTGEVGDQVAWLAFGSAVLCGAMAFL